MNILFFNRSFYPDTEATGQFLTELCEGLTDFGHSITVVCGKSYHVDSDKKAHLVQKELYKSINILRALGTTFPKRNLFFRLLNLGTYFLNAFFAGFMMKKRPDIVIALTDPPLLGLHGIFFSFWYRAKFVYYCKDVYPDVGMITGRIRHPIYIFILQIANILSFRLANKIICIGIDMKKKIESKGIVGDKIEVVNDWADPDELYPVPYSENPFVIKHGLLDKFIVMYSGNLGLTQRLDKVIHVAEHFKDNGKIQFLFIGEGAEKESLQNLVQKKGLDKTVRFLPYQPKEELKYSLSAASLHLITFEKGLSGVIVPSKVYGILACGQPFLASIDKESEIYSIAHKYNCGLTVEPGEYKELVTAINWAITNTDKLIEMGKNGRNAAVNFFNRKIATAKYNSIILDVSSNN